MQPLTLKQFRALEWKLVYAYDGQSYKFKTFACSVPGITVTHDFRKGKTTGITYAVAGRRTDSPSQAVKYFNEAERQASRPGIRDGAAPAQGIKA